jgi:hypothetical protein
VADPNDAATCSARGRQRHGKLAECGWTTGTRVHACAVKAVPSRPSTSMARSPRASSTIYLPGRQAHHSPGRGPVGEVSSRQGRTRPITTATDTRDWSHEKELEVMNAINLADRLSTFSEYWQPRVVGSFNGHDLMVVKVKGNSFGTNMTIRTIFSWFSLGTSRFSCETALFGLVRAKFL